MLGETPSFIHSIPGGGSKQISKALPISGARGEEKRWNNPSVTNQDSGIRGKLISWIFRELHMPSFYYFAYRVIQLPTAVLMSSDLVEDW
jgi:hypothetical protein